MLDVGVGKNRRAAAHAKRIHQCLCGKVVHGNAYTNHARRCVRRLAAMRYHSEGAFLDTMGQLPRATRDRLKAEVPAPVSRCPVAGGCRNLCDCPSCATWAKAQCGCYRCGASLSDDEPDSSRYPWT